MLAQGKQGHADNKSFLHDFGEADIGKHYKTYLFLFLIYDFFLV